MQYQYSSRWLLHKKGLFRDLFGKGYAETVPEPFLDDLENLRHPLLLNTLFTSHHLGFGFREHAPPLADPSPLRFRQVKEELCLFFESLGKEVSFAPKLFEEDRLLVSSLTPSRRCTLRGYLPLCRGYRLITPPSLFLFLSLLKDRRELILQGPQGSGKSTTLLQSSEILQKEGKTVFLFSSPEELTLQILSLLFQGDVPSSSPPLDSVLSLVDSPDTFFLYDGEREKSEVFWRLLKVKAPRSTRCSVTSLLPEPWQEGTFSLPPPTQGELEEIFFWCSPRDLALALSTAPRNLRLLRHHLEAPADTLLSLREKEALAYLFLTCDWPSGLSQEQRHSLRERHLVLTGEGEESVRSVHLDPLVLRQILREVPPESLRLDSLRFLHLLTLWPTDPLIHKAYLALAPNDRLLFRGEIPWEHFSDEEKRSFHREAKEAGLSHPIPLERVVQKSPQDCRELSFELLRRGRYKEAMAILPPPPDSSFPEKLHRLSLLRLTGESQEALKLLKLLRKEAKPEEEPLLNLEYGLLLHLLGEREKAAKLFKSLLHGSGEAAVKARRYLSYLSGPKEGHHLVSLRELYKESLSGENGSDPGEMASEIGQEAFRSSDFSSALGWFELSESLFRRRGDRRAVTLAAFNRGETLKETGHLREAKEIFQRAKAHDLAGGSNYSLSLDNLSLGEIAFFQEEYAEAASSFQEAGPLSPSLAPHLSLLKAVAFHMAGKEEPAGEHASFIEAVQEGREEVLLPSLPPLERPLERFKAALAIGRLYRFHNRPPPQEMELWKRESLKFPFYGNLLREENSRDSPTGRLADELFRLRYGRPLPWGEGGRKVSVDTLSDEERRWLSLVMSPPYSASPCPEGPFVGFQTTLASLRQWVDRIKNLPFHVLIVGDSGTGKEMLARYIHRTGNRHEDPFLSLNCAAVPSELLEATLFGYKKGAFTGADRESPGLIESAGRGTLFLDEIGDLPLAMQPKLLRVLQEREVLRIGDFRPRKVEAAFIFATNHNLERDVQEGRFREDLFYRIDEMRAELPPLDKRREDIPLLARRFVAKYSPVCGKGNVEIAEEAVDYLVQRPWKGNIRELETEVKRAMVRLGELEEVLKLEHFLPPRSGGQSTFPPQEILPLKRSREIWEADYLKTILASRPKLSREEMASLLKISRMQLYNLLKKHGIL